MRGYFDRWLWNYAVVSEAGAQDLLYNFYEPDTDRAHWIYPLLSGKAILWLLLQDRVTEAERLGRALLPFQQNRTQGIWRRTYGAFPSRIRKRGSAWKPGIRYYAGDNLCLIEALVALYSRTRKARFLESARAAGSWIVDLMCQGHDFGALAEPIAAPIQFMSANGVYSNKVYTNLEVLWLPALKRLGSSTNTPRFCRQADLAYEFYRNAQTRPGGFMDHYDPGNPPEPYDPARWRPYATAREYPNGQVIADSGLRAALGACRMGDLDSARRFYQWIRLHEGGVPAYLDVETGDSAFLSTDPVYFDVVSSGLHRNLSRWLGETQATRVDGTFLARTQHSNGGWYWGRFQETGHRLTGEQASIIGFWATADMAQPL